MGKKSKRRSGNVSSNNSDNSNYDEPSIEAKQQPIHPHSDGPSEEELTCIQTDSSTLQEKLDKLSFLANSNNKKEFVAQFVPLDLTQDEIDGFLDDLTNSPEAEGQWNHLKSEINALAKGIGVTKIEGDQTSQAIFFFEHPTLKGCDREVSFSCVNNEWRAEG